jgi:predicted outer membrane repeat protein
LARSQTDVVIKETSMVGGQGTEGGAIYLEDGSSLTMSDSYFERNFASVSGGAIYSTYSEGISISNCEFVMNRALSLGSHLNILYVSLEKEIYVINSKFRQRSVLNNAIYLKRSKAKLKNLALYPPEQRTIDSAS